MTRLANMDSLRVASFDRRVPEPARASFLASPVEIIDAARNGRMFILVDDERRENEGDLVIPAQMATPEAINFMATHGRGLVCLALTRLRVEQLELEPMSRNNRARHETAFTVSIEARDGVTTGISTADRARTIAVAIDAAMGRADIVTPGHVFPLVARDGGVLVREGHTEAAVDVAQLAGLNPAGVICEIMNDDGTMARMDDLVAFARRHDLLIGTIRDLIAYRCRHDRLVVRLAEQSFHSDHGGEWTLLTYVDSIANTKSFVLKKDGMVSARTLVRFHEISLFSDLLGVRDERDDSLHRAMSEIARRGAGVIVLVTNGGNVDSLMSAGNELTVLDYANAAQILADLGLQDVILHDKCQSHIAGLRAVGVNAVACDRIDAGGAHVRGRAPAVGRTVFDSARLGNADISLNAAVMPAMA